MGVFLFVVPALGQPTATFAEEPATSPAAAPAAPAPAPAAEPVAAAPAPAPAPAPASASEKPPSDEPPPPPEQPQEPTRYVSVTFSPFHLISPIFELEIEAMPIPHLGVALIGGIGTTTLDSTDPEIDGEKLDTYELGTQITGYPLKDFESLQLGAEVLWIRVSGENLTSQQISASAGGVSVGAFVGYKYMADIGFTLFVQGGGAYVVVDAEASDQTGNSASANVSGFTILLNFNLGWSF